MKRHFEDLADYNRWANRRLYADAAALPEEALHRDVGVYFTSLFATLEHILKVDRAWQHMLAGGAVADLPSWPGASDFAALHEARKKQDAALIDQIAAATGEWLDTRFEFQSGLASWQGLTYRGTHASVLTHLFNHQTHHRGQAHTALTLLGVEPSALDLLVKGMLGA